MSGEEQHGPRRILLTFSRLCLRLVRTGVLVRLPLESVYSHANHVNHPRVELVDPKRLCDESVGKALSTFRHRCVRTTRLATHSSRRARTPACAETVRRLTGPQWSRSSSQALRQCSALLDFGNSD